MASLQQTETRINSVTSTMKITKAMKLVATAKLRGARLNYESAISYYETIVKIIGNVAQIPQAKQYVTPRTKGYDVYIVISSELGLCGAYNTNMFKMIEDDEAKYVLLGKKAVAHFRHKDIIFQKSGITDDPKVDDIREVISNLFVKYANEEIRSIKVVSTKYRSSISFEPQITQLLPLEVNVDKHRDVDFEPSAHDILNYTLPRYMDAVLIILMKESLVSEYATRRIAMENASDNAQDLIDRLLIEKNRARQGAITQELSEIIAGSEAS